MQLLQVGSCSVCGVGSVGVRVSASGREVVALCDACDAVWTDPDMRQGPLFPEEPELPCPQDGSFLREFPAHWASREEAARLGWSDAVIGEAEAIG